MTLHPPYSRDIRGKLVFLGTGTSHGVPVVGCRCVVCRSADPRNARTRCSVVLGLPEGNLLIDTAPELRLQLVQAEIGLIHAVLYTHAHADHMAGLDDLRIITHYLGHDLPIHTTAAIERRVREAFAYAFDARVDKHYAGGVPHLTFHRIDQQPFPLLGAWVTPIPLLHGKHPCWGYRCGAVAYCTDVNQIPEESFALLRGLNVLVLDCLRQRPHPTHFTVSEAVAAAARIGARHTYFTHLCHELDHAEFAASLPPNMAPAYDGLTVEM